MKNLFLLISVAITMAVPSKVFSQNLEDVVHLKNGSVIRGMIVEQVPNESLKIETRDGNIFVYQMNEVEKMTKENNLSRNSTSNGGWSKGHFNKPQGYMGAIEAGGGIGVGDWGATRVSISMINGYRLMPQFAVGIGVGVEFFPGIYHESDNINYYSGSELSLPIFLHMRSDFIDGAVSPYAAVNVGYNVSLNGGFFGGFMLEPSLGVGFNIGQRNRMTVEVGFIMNQVKYAYGESYLGYNEGTAMGNALKLKVGLSF